MSTPLLRLMGRALLCVLSVAPVALSARADDPQVATFGQKDNLPTVTLAEGNYNLSDMNAAGLNNDAIISVKVTPGYKVIGYWDSDFSGDMLEITADCDNLNDLKPNWSEAISSLKVVPNGVRGLAGPVRFRNRNSGLFLDAENNSVSGGTLAVQYADGTDASQNWLLKEVADGVYNITSYKSYTQGLDCKDGQTGNGTSIQLVGVTDGNRHQQFIIYDRPDGDYQLVARNSGRVIEIGSSNKDSGAKANLYDNNGSDTQQWSLQAPSITELYIIGGAEGIGWDISNAQPLTKLANGVFIYRGATFNTEGGTQGFKILTEKDWDKPCFLGGSTGEFKMESGTPQVPCNWYSDTNGKPNYDITTSGTYDIVVDLNSHTLTVSAEMPEVNALYIVGDQDGNDGWESTPGRKVGNKFIFEGVRINGGCQFLLNEMWNWEQRLAANPYTGDDVQLTLGMSSPYTYITTAFKPTGVREPSFVLADGTYTIYVDMDAHTVMAVRYEVPEITSVYLYGGNINGLGWHPTGVAEKEGSKFTFRNVFVNEQLLQFVVNGTDVRYRLCPGPYGTDNVALDQCEGQTTGYSFVDTNNNPLGAGEPCFTLPAGQYDITVDTATGKVTATAVAAPVSQIDELYLIGNSVNSFSWNTDRAVKGERQGNVFNFSSVCVEGDFHFLVNGRKWDYRLCAGQYGQNGVNLWEAEGISAPYALLADADKPQGTGEPAYTLPRGVYDITVNLDNHTVTATPHGGDVVYTNFEIKSWEGPVYKALTEQGRVSNSDTFLPFAYYGRDTENGHDYEVYELKIADNIDPIEYASQMSLKGEVFTTSCTYDAGSRTFSFDESKNTSYAVSPAYFDAHTPDVLVPVTTEFWCDNARMEVGMTVKSIYVFFDRKEIGKTADGETPLYIMASSTGKPTFGAPVQRPLNSDSYSITLTSGTLYDALKGTQTGSITVPFARHHAAEGGFSINLGRYVTTGAEGFTFNVNGQPYTAGGFVFGGGDVDRLVSPTPGAGSALPATALTFNRIILMVGDKDGGKYNDYKLYLACDDLPDDYKKYGREAGLPMLKVWTGLDYVTTKWSDLYDSGVQADATDGDVKYYKFQPVMSQQGNQTNLYYLDLSNGGQGVRISRFIADGDSRHYDQFNIVDNNGYDISTPYQGSQLMYTGQWWCANPNLVVDDAAYDRMSAEEKAALREYNGLRFKPVQKTDSRVDLCWNEDATIYGISLFKIMGHGYDVYADAVIERPLYYLYAHTEPRSGESVRDKVEKTAPILFELTTKEGYGKPGYADWTLYNESGKYTTALNGNDNRYYVVKLSDKTLDSNDDLNYLLTPGDYEYTPGCTQPFEFVDVTGDQRWTGTGEADKLRPNIWSNYNTGMLNTDSRITLLNGNAKYFKIVLATNPDQTRYQVMSRGISILPQGELMYDSHHDADHKAEDLLIYPTTDINGSFFWQKGATELTVTLHFTDESGNDVTTTEVKISKEEAEANKLPDQQGFFEEGEFTFTLDLGKYCTNPDWRVYASAEFDNGGNVDQSASYETCGYDVPGISDIAVSDTSKDGDDKGDYYATVTWKSDDSAENPGLPREYEIHSYDVTGNHGADEQNVPDSNRHQTDYDVHAGDKAGSLNSDADLTWQEYTYGQLVTTGATPISNTDKKEVEIGYTVTPVYYYSVPQNEAMKWNDDISYTYTGNRGNDGNGNAPDGFKVVEQTPDPSRTATVFNGDTTTGIDAVDAEAAQGATEIYTLSGVRVIGEPAPGIYIVRQGDKAVKTVIR